MHRNIWAGPCSSTDRWPACPVLLKWLLPSLSAHSSVLSHQSWHLQIHSWQLQQVKMFLQMVLNWFSPLLEWEDGWQLFNSFQRSNTQQLQKKCGEEVAPPRLQEPPAEWNSISQQTYFWEILFGPLTIIDSPGLGDRWKIHGVRMLMWMTVLNYRLEGQLPGEKGMRAFWSSVSAQLVLQSLFPSRNAVITEHMLLTDRLQEAKDRCCFSFRKKNALPSIPLPSDPS